MTDRTTSLEPPTVPAPGTGFAPTSRLVTPDILRALAALAVSWFHLTNTWHGGPVEASGARGWLGVQVFFVISGFVIPYAISRVPDYSIRQFPLFMCRRLIRLEPPYLISVALTLVLLELSRMTPGFRGAPPHIFLGQVAAHVMYLIPFTHYQWLQPVYWTLGYEFVFYIAIGLLFPLICRPRQAATFWAAAALIIAGNQLGLLSVHHLFFVMGVAVYRYVVCRDHWGSSLAAVAAAGVAAAVDGALLMPLVGGATALAIAAGGVSKRTPGGTLVRVMTGLGTISYSLYLLHVPIGGRVVNLGARFVDGSIGQLIVSLAALLGTLAAAVIFWYFVECPFMRASRSIAVRPTAETEGHWTIGR